MTKFTPGQHRAAKLAPDQVIEIRRLYAEAGWSQGRLAREFEMSVGQIGRIVRGESWTGYTLPPTEQEIAHRMLMDSPPSAAEIAASAARLTAKLTEPSPPPDPPPEAPEDYASRISRMAAELRERSTETRDETNDTGLAAGGNPSQEAPAQTAPAEGTEVAGEEEPD